MFDFPTDHNCILVIDDDASLQRQIRFYLEKQYKAIQVKQALNGSDGLQLARSASPALIILDWVLPDIEGPDILVTLKTEENTQQIPVLMLSGKNKMGGIEEVFNLDADAYITKPFSLQRLGEKVQSLLDTEE